VSNRNVTIRIDYIVIVQDMICGYEFSFQLQYSAQMCLYDTGRRMTDCSRLSHFAYSSLHREEEQRLSTNRPFRESMLWKY
jgi:hypothetical protein